MGSRTAGHTTQGCTEAHTAMHREFSLRPVRRATGTRDPRESGLQPRTRLSRNTARDPMCLPGQNLVLRNKCCDYGETNSRTCDLHLRPLEERDTGKKKKILRTPAGNMHITKNII